MELCDDLADKITHALVAEGLLVGDDATRIAPRISAGTMSQPDWKIAVEKRLDQDRSNGAK